MSEPKKESGCVPTLNKMGYMFPDLNEYSRAFVEYVSGKKGMALDIGSAYGVATLPALWGGATVYANDIEEKHLEVLKKKAGEKLKQRLHLVQKRFPAETEFPEASFDAIHASRVFHFLLPEDFILGLQKVFKWLKPGGKFYLVAASPYMGSYIGNLKFYHKRKKDGDLWPGFIEAPSKFIPERAHTQPSFINPLDEDVLRRTVPEAGFFIEKISYLSVDDMVHLPEMTFDGREEIGLIALKKEQS